MIRFLSWVLEIAKYVIIHAVSAIGLSAVFSLLQWIGSLLSWSKPPTWSKFLWGSLVLFVVLVVYHLFLFLLTVRRCMKDPVFRKMHVETGISWRDYKMLRENMWKHKYKVGDVYYLPMEDDCKVRGEIVSVNQKEKRYEVLFDDAVDLIEVKEPEGGWKDTHPTKKLFLTEETMKDIEDGKLKGTFLFYRF